MKLKVVLFLIPTGWAIRYLLNEQILAQLQAQDLKIIILCPDPEYVRQLVPDALKITSMVPQKQSQSRWETLFKRLRRFSSPASQPGTIVDARYKEFLDSGHMSSHNLLFLRVFVNLLRRSHLLRYGLIEIESRLFSAKEYAQYFQEYDVRLVVTAGLGYVFSEEAYLLRTAKVYDIPSLCVIPSWDHPSTKGLGGAKADHYAVWGPEMRQELIHYHDASDKRITMTGAAIFDIYADHSKQESREAFCARYDLEPEKKIILFATNSPVGFPHNPDIVEYLAESMVTHKLNSEVQIIVRLHPNHFHKWRIHGVDPYNGLEEKFPFLCLSIPVVNSLELPGSMSSSENVELSKLIHHADIVINYFSTVQLDAAICDKPIINIGFNWGTAVNPTQQPNKFKNYTHLKRTLSGVSVANHPEEMIQQIKHYLSNPGLHAKGRQKIVENECGIVDGKASHRIGNLIYRLVSTNGREKPK